MKNDATEIKALLVRNAEALARELLPDGQRQGNYWKARCPWRADKHIGSFWVNLKGQMQGTYHDAAAGETGDALTLIAKVHGLDVRRDFAKVLDWARAFLGLANVAPAEMKRRVSEAQAAGELDERAAAERAEQDRRRAFALYLRARREPFLGSGADLYLQGRGIYVRRLGRMPGCLGFLPEWRREDGSMVHASMLAGFTGPDGRIVAVHRTFIAPKPRDDFERDFQLPERWDKAPVDPVRKIWPSFGGAAIRLWRGDSKLREREAAEAGLLETLVLVEGVEDGLSVALARPDYRIWCAGSLGNLASIVLPECCDRVIVCADNDWGKPQALAQLDKALVWLAGHGREVLVARSPIGKDANDALRGSRQ